MHRKIFLILISVVTVYTDEIEYNENFITTESYQELYAAVSAVDFDGLRENDFIPVKCENTGQLNKNICSTNRSGFDEIETVTENTQTSPSKSREIDEENAKIELRAWAENMDCSNSAIGTFRCVMIKKGIQHYCDHSDEIEVRKLALRLKTLLSKMDISKIPIDPDLKKLIQKYKSILDAKYKN